MAGKNIIQELLSVLKELLRELSELTRRIGQLEKENQQLKEQLANKQLVKNSQNSSIAPSKDENRLPKTSSLRIKTGRKPGGQPGHKGNTLKMTDTPDKIIAHTPQQCNGCGKDISELKGELTDKRQTIEIPPVFPVYVEHQVYKKTCTCGHITQSKFPTGINARISYGKSVESLVAYLHSRQYIAFDRLRETFNDVFGLPISEGGLHCVLTRIVKKAQPFYELIRSTIEQSPVVGADETGAKVNGKKHWFWTWQNPQATYIAISNNRGMDTVNAHFKNGFPNSSLVHDCWKCHFGTHAKGHQPCIPHLQRELKYLADLYKHKWAEKFNTLLTKAVNLEKQMRIEDYPKPFTPRSDLEETKSQLLDEKIDAKHNKLVTFQKRMIKYQNYLFTFLHEPQVPPDNNASERAIRNVKVKLKVSGQFKTIEGAAQFAVLRSVTDTALKTKQNILDTLNSIANGQYNHILGGTD